MKRFVVAFILAVSAVAPPAFADVKQGVDAWDQGKYAEAVAIWRPFAISGDADAQYNLGQAYKLGRGVPVDLQQAELWFQKAAVQGHRQAQDIYGLILSQLGRGKAALPWLEKSAARGDARAQYLLGTALFNGDDVPKDWVRAYALMIRASSSGLARASQTLTQMDEYIPLEQRQRGLGMSRDIEIQAMRPAHDVPTVAHNQRTAPRPVPSKPVVTKPVVAKTVAVAVANGPWRIQLGAFSAPEHARKLGVSLAAKLPGLKAYYVPAGNVTRVQFGGFTSREKATDQCKKLSISGQACFVVKV